MNSESNKVEIPFTEAELGALFDAVTGLLPDVDAAYIETPDLLRAWVRLADGMHLFKMRAEDAAPVPLRLVD